MFDFLSQIKKIKNQSIPDSLFRTYIISYLKRTGEKKIKSTENANSSGKIHLRGKHTKLYSDLLQELQRESVIAMRFQRRETLNFGFRENSLLGN